MKTIVSISVLFAFLLSGDCLATNQDDLIFDPAIDEQLADFIIEREAEYSDVQSRGSVAKSSRSRRYDSGASKARISATEFRKQTSASGLQAAIAHVESVRKGGRPNPKLIAEAIMEAHQANPQQDVMRSLFSVFRESIQETNSDKRYFLAKLADMNQISEAMGDYLKELNDALGSGTGSGSDSGSGCDNSGPSEEELSLLDPDHRALADRMLKERLWTQGDAEIRRTIRQLQQMESEVRNRRQKASTAFQNFDQKSNQLYNLLSSVMKAMNEMRMGTVRNML